MTSITKTALALSFTTLLGATALPAIAQDKPNLTVYTYDAFAADWGPGPGLEKGFEAQCNCTIDIVAADSSIGALRRVQLEGQTTKADIVLGLDTSLAQEAIDTGLFTAHSVDTSSIKLPVDWTSETFVPFDYGYFAFVYDKDRLPEPPVSFEDLASDGNDLKIVIQDPRSSTPGLGLVLWLKAAYGDDTNEAWAELAPKVLTMTKSWSDAYNLFLEGEADMVLSYTTSPAYHIVAEEDETIAAAQFREGHYTQIEIAGILKSSPNKDLANQFLAYLITPEAQAMLPHTNWMYPVIDLPGGTPEGFENLIDAKPALSLPDAEINAHKSEWIDEALAAFK
jgi:thiamine transport system substrate-binding protein